MFNPIYFTQLLWTLGANLPTKTDILVARLDLTTKWLKHLNTVLRERLTLTLTGVVTEDATDIEGQSVSQLIAPHEIHLTRLK